MDTTSEQQSIGPSQENPPETRKPKYALSLAKEAELDERYQYHAPKNDQPQRYVLIRETAKHLARVILENTPQSRDQSVALTKLEEVVMRANAAIAINE